MIELSEYAVRVVDRLSMMGNWLAVVISLRNLHICLRLYRRTRGNIHLVNTIQVVVLILDRFLYGIIPLFEIHTCAFFPLLISFWHVSYLLYYVIMFMRLLILEDRRALWFRVVGIGLILLRFADWPYELTFHQVQQSITTQIPQAGSSCYVSWGNGVLILNFVSDSVANLFLSGMFVRRLYIHVQHTKTVMSRQHRLIEHIARKSLVCLIFTFVVNLAMNLLKITSFIGDRSDAFTVYFQLIESTLLVEALRVENRPGDRPIKAICENCGMVLDTVPHSDEPPQRQQQQGSYNGAGTAGYHRGRGSKATTAMAMDPTESVLQDMAMFDTDSYIEDTKPSNRQPGMTPTPPPTASNDILLQSPMPTIAPHSSTPSTMSFVSSPPRLPSAQQPHYLTQHPEWSNNDYRMF